MSCPFAGDFCAGVSPVVGYVGLCGACSPRYQNVKSAPIPITRFERVKVSDIPVPLILL